MKQKGLATKIIAVCMCAVMACGAVFSFGNKELTVDNGGGALF